MNLITPRPKITVEGIAASGEVSPDGVVKHREHWSGEIDAKVLPATKRFRAKPSWRDWLRIMELEDATAELKAARLSGSREAIRRAEYRLGQARAMFDQVRMRHGST